LEAPDKRQVAWSEVWALYRDHQVVFRAVFSDLRVKGFSLSKEVATDLTHEFLLERAPFALATFKQERGLLESWLFVVFRRFVTGTFRSHKRGQAILDKWQHDLRGLTVLEGPDTRHDLEAIEKALATLPPEEQEPLLLFLGAGDGSIREVARRLGLSRWKAERQILQAFARIARQLRVEVGLDAADLGLIAGDSVGATAAIDAAKRRSSQDTKAAIRRSRLVLSELLNIGESRKR